MSKYFKKNNGKSARSHPRLRKNASRLLAPTTTTTATAARWPRTSVGENPAGVLWGRKLPRTWTKTTQRQKERSVFSNNGGRYACTCPHNRMMQAGDVETNPGPSCPVCDRVITANHTPMPCVACGVAVHGACTGLSRVRREKGERYICRGCGGVRERERCAVCSQTFRTNSRRVPCRSCGLEVHGSCSALTREALRRGYSYECSGCGERGIQPPPDPPSQEGRVERKGERCVVCQVTLRRGAGCACCPGCNRKAHKKCVDRRVEGWRCEDCGGPVPAAPPEPALPPPGPPPPPDPELPPGPPPPPETRNERCPECNIRLRRALDPLVCRACGLQYHTKCSGLTRDALAVQRRAGTWRCGTCTRQEERRVQLPEVRELTSLKAAHKLKTLKLLQWNCNGLVTKKDELEELMQRRGVHVALIQETKLGGKDRTPNIRGPSLIVRQMSYEIIRPSRGQNIFHMISFDHFMVKIFSIRHQSYLINHSTIS